MDNAQIHKANILKETFSKLNIFSNAPYSPFLNPIEEFFAILKARVRKNQF
jgi:transposase